MGDTGLESLLTILLYVFGAVLALLVTTYIVIYLKNRPKKEKKKDIENGTNKTYGSTLSKNKNPIASIYDFMEFEDIQDNMIIQKEKQKYVMVVECQGINYDLMSEIEKNAVEEGFLQFLNTIRHPIQLYIQTRTVNLENSINTYKRSVDEIEKNLERKRLEYNTARENPNISDSKKQELFYSVIKQTNLFEYGKDIIADTERMSQNKNILNKKYFVIIPYYVSDENIDKYEYYEVRNRAFSELYTRSQAIIRTLSACGVQGRILNSKDLVELLYVAYNRDHEEDFNFDRALQAQYDKLYTSSEDVYKKRIDILDKKIEEKAIEKAQEKAEQAKSELQRKAEEKEATLDELADELAKIILSNNSSYLGEEVTNKAIESIENEKVSKKETKAKRRGGKNNG